METMKTMEPLEMIGPTQPTQPTNPRKRQPRRRRAAYAEFVQHDFFAPPWWRWLRAFALATSPSPKPTSFRDDPMTLDGVGFVRARAGCPASKSQARRHSILSDALAIHSENGTTRWALEAYTLTGLSREAIAGKLGLDVALISVYEEMFFDVRGRLGARDWIARHTFGIGGPSRGFGRGDLGSLWQWVGYTSGEFALDAVRAVTTGVGAENYPQTLRDSIERFHALTQFLAVCTASELHQVYLRMRAREAGAPASAYLIPAQPARGKNRGTPGHGHPNPAVTSDPAPLPPDPAGTVQLLEASWDSRGNAPHYVHVVRLDGKRRRISLGTGAVGRMHELLDRQEQHEQEQGRLEVKVAS